jgi:hypothetical protein
MYLRPQKCMYRFVGSKDSSFITESKMYRTLALCKNNKQISLCNFFAIGPYICTWIVLKRFLIIFFTKENLFFDKNNKRGSKNVLNKEYINILLFDILYFDIFCLAYCHLTFCPSTFCRSTFCLSTFCRLTFCCSKFCHLTFCHLTFLSAIML